MINETLVELLTSYKNSLKTAIDEAAGTISEGSPVALNPFQKIVDELKNQIEVLKNEG